MSARQIASERIRKVEAIVIAHKEFGEADRLIRLFSCEYGKLTAIAKGVRKIQSRKAAHLEPFTHASLVLAYGHSFWIISQADTLINFPNIRADLARTANAAYVLELVDRAAVEGQPDRALFRLTLETLQRLEAQPDAFNALRSFEFRFLDLAGFRPELTHCVACKKEIQPKDQYFSVAQGGALCPTCGAMDARALGAKKDTLRYLRHFQRSTYAQLDAVQVPAGIRKEMQKLMGAYIAYMMEGQLKTPEFIQQIRVDRPGSMADDIQ